MSDLVERLRTLHATEGGNVPLDAAMYIERLEKALEAWNSAVRVDVLMEGPRYMGVSGEAGRRAWELTRATLEDRT